MISRDDGSPTAPIALVCEAYGHWETVYERPLVGPTWTDKLLPWLTAVGLRREDLYITNTWDQGQPDKIDRISADDMKAAMERCRRRIDALPGPDGRGPRVIVCAGNYALYTFTGNGVVSFHTHDGRHKRPGIGDWRGSILRYQTGDGRIIKVIPTPHPAGVFRHFGLEWVCMKDWERIAGDAQFYDLRLPQRTRMIAPSKAELFEWIKWTRAEAEKRKKGLKYYERLACSLDVETPNKVEYDTRQAESKSEAPGVKCRECGHTRRWHNSLEAPAVGIENLDGKRLYCAPRRGKKVITLCPCTGFAPPLGKPRKVKVKEEAYLGCVGWSWDPKLSMTAPTTLEYWQDPAVFAAVMAEIAAFHADENVDFGGQNLPFDAWWGAHTNTRFRIGWDLMKMHRVQRPWSEWNDLAFQASLDTREPFWKHESKLPDEVSRWSHNKEQLWCLEESTPVLKADFSVVPIGSLTVGDRLLGPDENGGAQRHGEVSRRWRVTTVERMQRSRQECLKITLESGRHLVLSENHRLMVDLGSNGKRWKMAGLLNVGNLVVVGIDYHNRRFVDAESRGWLGGFLDGEGTLYGISMRASQHGRSGLGALSYAQKPGIVLDRADDITRALGFGTSKKCPIGATGSAVATYLRGGTQASFALLTEVPAHRLRAGFVRLIERGDVHATGLRAERIIAIEAVGVCNTVDIQTSTKTFIANGIVSHNSYNGTDNCVQRELLDRRLEGLRAAGRWEYYEEIEAPEKIDEELLELSLWGMRADEPGRLAHFTKCKEEAARIGQEMNEIAEMKIVARIAVSPKQMKVFLYEKLRLPVQYTKNAKKEKVVSTDVVTIKRLMEQFPTLAVLQEVGTRALRHRRLGVEANFVKAAAVDADGRIRGQFRQDTSLGRTSCSKTPKKTGRNLQNIDRKLRQYFLPDTGDEVL